MNATSFRLMVGLIAAWSVGMNGFVLYHGIKLNRTKDRHTAWLYPGSLMLASAIAIALRIYFTVQHAPLGITDDAAFVTSVVFAITGFQGARRIVELEGEAVLP